MSVLFKTTHGDLPIELYLPATPTTSYNFLALCASSYYTSIPIHRIVPGFLIQTGDGTLKTGKGGTKPEDTIRGQHLPAEISPALRHTRGAVCCVNLKGDPNKGTNQWYVCLGTHRSLDGQDVVFGRVVGAGEEGEPGEETLRRIEGLPTDKKGRPQDKVEILEVRIRANPLAEEQED